MVAREEAAEAAIQLEAQGSDEEELPAASEGPATSDEPMPQVSRPNSPEPMANGNTRGPDSPPVAPLKASGRCAGDKIQEAPASGLLQDMEWRTHPI